MSTGARRRELWSVLRRRGRPAMIAGNGRRCGHAMLEAAQVSSVMASCLREGEEAWLVGGAVRDGLAGRSSKDLDYAVRGDVARLARCLADLLGGACFEYSEAFSTFRVLPSGGVVDLSPLRGSSLDEDLAARDFTIDAMALPVRAGDPGGRMGVGVPIDPLGGMRDLSRRRLCLCSPSALEDDPVRIVRMARLATALDLEPAPGLVESARTVAKGLASVSDERVGQELTALLGLDAAADAVRLLDRAEGLAVVLPEVAALRGCAQNPYHHLDVFDHTIEALAHTPQLVDQLGGRQFLASPDDCGLCDAPPLAPLAWAVLLHDIGKPAVRRVDEEGRVIFWHHDEVGATMADVVVRRLGLSRRFSHYLGVLILNHLRLGFLVREAPLTRRVLARYRRAVEPFVFESVVLSLADRLATRGPRTSARSLARHYRLARRVWLGVPKETRPLPLDGRDVIGLLGLEEGPVVGRALAALRDEVDAGSVEDADEARQFLLGWWKREGEAGADA